MSQLYADRAFLAMNGVEFQDVQTASLEMVFNAKAVNTMTRKPWNKGFVQGNTDINLDFTLAVQNALGTPKVDQLDYVGNNVSLNFQCGADIYTANNLFIKNAKMDASGIGDESKKTAQFGALSLVDSVGNSALFVTSITLRNQ